MYGSCTFVNIYENLIENLLGILRQTTPVEHQPLKHLNGHWVICLIPFIIKLLTSAIRTVIVYITCLNWHHHMVNNKNTIHGYFQCQTGLYIFLFYYALPQLFFLLIVKYIMQYICPRIMELICFPPNEIILNHWRGLRHLKSFHLINSGESRYVRTVPFNYPSTLWECGGVLRTSASVFVCPPTLYVNTITHQCIGVEKYVT